MSMLLKLGLTFKCVDVEDVYNDIKSFLDDNEPIFTMDEFEDLLIDEIFTADELNNKIKFGNFSHSDDFVSFDGYANLDSFNYTEFTRRVNDIITDNLPYNEDLQTYWNELFNIGC